MSEIAGIWHLDGAPVDREFARRISLQLQTNGAELETTHFDKCIGMIYRPVHTMRKSTLEHQPYETPAGNVILWNGRLDNGEDLMSELGIAIHCEQTDLAIVASAIDRWGVNAFVKIVGDWALAIWNPKRQELLLARDYIGVRQLFYYPSSTRIVWCSQLAPIALCGDRFTLCDEYVAGYLAFYPDAHLTPYSQIHSVPPGNCVRICPGETQIQAYWIAGNCGRVRYRTDDEYVEQYQALFRQAVRRRLRTDSPILAELSGGLDSSSVVCVADDLVANGDSHVSCLDTFSFYDSNEPEENDVSYFTTVEAQRGKNGIHVDLASSGDYFLFDKGSFVATPGTRGRAQVRSALVKAVERSKYRVMLSGFGGDQINGQTLDPRILMADLLVQLRIIAFVKELRSWSSLIRKRPLIQLFLQTLVQLVPIQIRSRFNSDRTTLPWVQRRFGRKYHVSARMLEVIDGVWFANPAERDAVQTIATISRELTNLEPSIIEKRYPYLDRDFVEFMTSIPLNQVLRPGRRRWLMRRALANSLPKEVLDRTVKSRVARYPCVVMEKHWHRIEKVLATSIAAQLGFVSRADLHYALWQMKNGRIPIYLVRLINALSLELWLRDVNERGVVDLGPHECLT